MPRPRIEWKMVEPSLRKLRKDDLVDLLRSAFDALPAGRRASIFGEYASDAGGKSPAPERLLEAVKKFHASSLAREYYECFAVNSKNYRETSEGTVLWIRECNRLFDQCVVAARKGHHAQARASMDLLFDLLEKIDRESDDIIFFADEPGSWQVGVDDERVLAAYFTSLAAIAEPDEYTARVATLTDRRAPFNRDETLRAARRAAKAAHRRALQVALGG